MFYLGLFLFVMGVFIFADCIKHDYYTTCLARVIVLGTQVALIIVIGWMLMKGV